jgi:fatty acid desaturase
MAVAARVSPKDFFTADEWVPLPVRSSWKGLALVAHGWLVILAVGAMAVIWPITLPLAIMIIGARQLGLAILMHDAAHGALHPNSRVNDWVAEWVCSGGLIAYRNYHLQHHKYAQQSEDPDLVLSAPFPVTRASLRRKILRDLTGQTWFKQRFGRLTARLKAREAGEPVLPILGAEIVRQRRWLIGNTIGAILLTLACWLVSRAFGGAPRSVASYWWVWFALWLAPRATWFQLVTRLRNIAEHALVAKDEPDPLRHARTTHANFLERAFIAPYFVNYHCEHHMFMHVPCWNLPRVRRLLANRGVAARMEGSPCYLSVLNAASAA